MRDLLYGALCALMITAACGGSDPPGGGNGDTDGGGNNTVNLIEAIPGRWRVVRVAGQPGTSQGDVRVDVNDPDCRQRIAETYTTFGPGGDPTAGSPGDACIAFDFQSPGAFILDGASIRFDAQEPSLDGTLMRIRAEGTVLNDGARMEFTSYNYNFNPPDTAQYEMEKVR